MNPKRSKLSLAAAFAAAMTLAACDNNGEDDNAPVDDAAPAMDEPAPVPAPAESAPAPAESAPAEPAPAPGGASAAVPAAPAPAADADAAMPDGEQVFAAAGCAGCHGVDGGGGVGPELAGNQNANDATYVVTQILQGGETMPPFADRLTNEEIAAVANYVRNAWGNAATEPIAPADVEAARGAAP